MPIDSSDPRPEYWTEYTNLQFVKHRLIHEYLSGWFPKLGTWAGRIVYLDTHAGRGRHEQGQAGSPLVALTTLLQHSSRDRILARSEAVFLFIEADNANADQLRNEIAELGAIPDRVTIEVNCNDAFTVIEQILTQLYRDERPMAPAFVFVDPYGFKVPGRLLRELMKFRRVELFVNVIWRELDMAIVQAKANPLGGMAQTLDRVFDGGSWASIDAPTVDERADKCVSLLQSLCEATWATRIRMLGDNRVTRYVLLHLTNHDAGRDLMKECLWKICPSGGFQVSRSDNPNQSVLIEPQPDLKPLEGWLLGMLGGQDWPWQDLLVELRGQLWREKQLNELIRRLRREGKIEASEYEGVFAPSSNPLLHLNRR